MSGRARRRLMDSLASWSAAARQSASHVGQIIAVPWLFTHSPHQPLPHWEQTPSDGTDACVAQRRQALADERVGREAVGRGAVPVGAGAAAARAAGAGRTGAGVRAGADAVGAAGRAA